MQQRLFLLLVAISLLAPLAQAQEQPQTFTSPNLQAVEEACNDAASPYYFPALLARYQANDTTLNEEEYRYLYLGYTYQEEYNPYYQTSHGFTLESLPEGERPTVTTCDSMVATTLRALDDAPFDIRQLNLLIYAYQCLGNEAAVTTWNYKLTHLIEAILSTGDGKTPQTAWYVITPADQYEVINRLGLVVTEHTTPEPHTDYLRVAHNKYNIKGFYFNIERVQSEYLRKYATH